MRDRFFDRKLFAAWLFVGAMSSSSATEPKVLGRIRVMADAGTPTVPESPNNSKSPVAKPKRAPDVRPKPATSTKPEAPTKAEPEIESQVLQMIKQHMPKIDQMLIRLRESNPADYQRAIRDLAKSVRKLELAKKRDEVLFEIELEILKSRSDVNLLTAKLKLRDGDSDRESLRTATGKLQRAEIARDEYEVKVLEERLASTERLIGTLKERIASKKQDSEAEVEKSYIGYLRKAGHNPSDASSTKDAPRKKNDAKKSP